MCAQVVGGRFVPFTSVVVCVGAKDGVPVCGFCAFDQRVMFVYHARCTCARGYEGRYNSMRKFARGNMSSVREAAYIRARHLLARVKVSLLQGMCARVMGSLFITCVRAKNCVRVREIWCAWAWAVCVHPPSDLSEHHESCMCTRGVKYVGVEEGRIARERRYMWAWGNGMSVREGRLTFA